MRLNAGKVLGISITVHSKEKILEYLHKYLEESFKLKAKTSSETVKPVIILTPNPEQIVAAQTDAHLRDLLNQADITLPDGIGAVWAGKVLGTALPPKRISGVDFMEDLVGLALSWGVSIALIGGRTNLAVNALECLRNIHPSLRGWAVDGPELHISNAQLRIHNARNAERETEQYFEELAERLFTTKTCFVFVGLGAPKQEYFIEKLVAAWNKRQALIRPSPTPEFPLEDTHPLIIMAVGGSFSMIAGKTPRAPGFLRERGLEWLWRLILEPWRIGRQLTLLTFVRLVMKEKRAKRLQG